MLFILNRDEEVLTVFNNNGSPDSCPYYDDLLKENLNYGTSTYEFTVPVHPNSDLIQEGGYVIRQDLDGRSVMYTIMQIEETHSNTREKIVFGENTGMEIINSILRPATYNSLTASEVLDEILQDTRWEKGEVDDLGKRTIVFEEFENKLLRLEEVARTFDAEIDFTVKIANGRVVNRYVNLREKIGADTKKRFTYTKDIHSITRNLDMTELVTALIGVGKGENENYLSFASQVWTTPTNPTNKPNGQDWVGDEEALQRYGIKGKHIFGVYEYDTDSASELLNRTWTRLQQLKEPKITYELDVALLEVLANYEHEKVRIGDTVYVIDETFNPPLYLEARVKELETSFTNPQNNKCVLGNFKSALSNITKEMRAIQAKLLKKENTWDQIQQNIIFKDPIPPEFPPIGGLWMDTGSVPSIIYRYDGEQWVSASPTNPEDIGAFGFEAGELLQTTVSGMDDKIEGAKQEAIGHTDGRLDDEGGIVDQIATVASDLVKTNQSITAKFQATGGNNLIVNSIGYSTDFFTISGTVNTEQNLELEQLGFGSGFVTDVGKGGYLEQTFNTTLAETYTISFYMKKTIDNAIDGYAGLELYIDGQKIVFVGLDSGTGITEGYERFQYTFETHHTEATIRIVFGNNAKAVLTGLMVNQGDEPQVWSMANGEVWNTNIVMNLNGIKVINNATKGYTLISSDEFSGYATVLDKNNNPIVEKVFTLNGDVTEVSKIEIDKELNMPPIKIVPIYGTDTTTYQGWAFIPST